MFRLRSDDREPAIIFEQAEEDGSFVQTVMLCVYLAIVFSLKIPLID